MTIENKNIGSNQSFFDGFPNGVYGPIKNTDGKEGFVSRRFGQEELIPIAEGQDVDKAKIIVSAYHELKINPTAPVEDAYVDIVCRGVKSLALPKTNQ